MTEYRFGSKEHTAAQMTALEKARKDRDGFQPDRPETAADVGQALRAVLVAALNWKDADEASDEEAEEAGFDLRIAIEMWKIKGGSTDD